MELMKVLMISMLVFAVGCTDGSSKSENKTFAGSPAGPAGSKPVPKKNGEADPKTDGKTDPKANPKSDEKTDAGNSGAPKKSNPEEEGDPDDSQNEDGDEQAKAGVAGEIDRKVALKGAAVETGSTSKTTTPVSDVTTSVSVPAVDSSAKKPESEATKAADDSKSASPEQLNAVKQVAATLTAAHLQLVNKTERQFNIAKNAVTNSVLKEISTYLSNHLDRTGVAEKLVQYAGDCANRETKKRSKIGFRGTGDAMEMHLFLAACDSKTGETAATIKLRPSQNSFELTFFNERLSSTSVAWVQLISNEGQCTFFHKRANYGADALVQMDCGETRGKCGADAVDQLPRFKGVAIAIPSARPGVTEIAMFERFFQYNETHGSEHYPKKFYSCAHRFEQKRTECTSDCLERKVTTVMVLKDEKYHVSPDYLNDAKRAFEKTDREKKALESQASVEAVRKQVAEAKVKAAAAASAQHQAELKRQQQEAGEGFEAEEVPAGEAKEDPNAKQDLTTDGSAQYPQAPKPAALKPQPQAVDTKVKPRSELTQEELDKLSPEQLELAEEADRKKEDARDSIP